MRLRVETDFFERWTQSDRVVAGVMTGTSMDGIDVCVMHISAAQGEEPPVCSILKHQQTSFSTSLQSLLRKLLTDNIHVSDYSLARTLYSQEIANAVAACASSISASISACAVHGQTLFHAPSAHPPHTLQMLNAAEIAERVQVLTIHDFRSADIAKGGQGAPLVPAADAILFAQHAPTAIVNIGGIANVTIIDEHNGVAAWDTGPGNCIMDEYAQRFLHRDYDADGAIAQEGSTHVGLLNAMLQHPHFSRPAPKSTGREVFHLDWFLELVETLDISELSHSDALRTLAELTVRTIALAIPSHMKTLWLAGGGAHNATLIRGLESRGFDVKFTNDAGVPVEAREAACFALLGWLRCAGRTNVVASVTGASNGSCSGSLTFPAGLC